MTTGITLIEFATTFGGLSVAIVSAWIHMRIAVGQLKTQIEYLEKQVEEEKADNKENYKLLTDKIGNLFKLCNEIKVDLEGLKK